MNLARIRQNRMRTVNLSSPELEGGLEPGETLTLLDVAGAGQIVRLHITMGWTDPQIPRKALLKIYWDGEEYPSVLCPVGDFFCDAFCGESIQFATQCFGNRGPIYTYEGKADYSSVVYWYQVEPHDSSIYQGHAVEERLLLDLKVTGDGQ